MEASTAIVLLKVISLIFCPTLTEADLKPISINGCAYLGDNLTFMCTTIGNGTTVFGGSAFHCPSTNNEITLRHSQFKNANHGGTCNNDSIVAQFDKIEGDKYTSQVQVRITSDLLGKTINCSHDNGTETKLIGSYLFHLSDICEKNHENYTHQDDSKLSTGGIVAIVLCLLILSFLVVTLFVCLVLLRKSRPHLLTCIQPSQASPKVECKQQNEELKSNDLDMTKQSEDLGMNYALCHSDYDQVYMISNYSRLQHTNNHNVNSDVINMKIEGVVHGDLEGPLDTASLANRLSKIASNQWYQLGQKIGVPNEVLHDLWGCSDAESLERVLDYWLKHHPDQPTWKEIADAVEDIKNAELAHLISSHYEFQDNGNCGQFYNPTSSNEERVYCEVASV